MSLPQPNRPTDPDQPTPTAQASPSPSTPLPSPAPAPHERMTGKPDGEGRQADPGEPLTPPIRSIERPYPDGWFAVATSAEVRIGKVVTRRLAGQDVVLYRTSVGRLRAVRPFCPHLGAHLGHGGTVRGENLVCPFHRFEFAPNGACVRTGYDTPPPAARLGLVEHREIDGLIFVWRHAQGKGPTWEIDVPPPAAFPRARASARTVAAHPDDFMENVVDYGHFVPLHKVALEVVSPPHFLGARMMSAYRLGRADDQSRSAPLWAPAMETTAYGLGVLYGEATSPRIGLHVRNWTCVTPVSPGQAVLRSTVTVRFTWRRYRWLARALAALISVPFARATVSQSARDVAIWRHRAHVEHPRLARGDGPIMRYRRWAAQFTSVPSVPTADAQPTTRIA